MNVENLKNKGISEKIVDLWQSCGIKNLTPIQEKAVVESKVLDGENVVVFAPTSSGKTFVGEMAAIRTAYNLDRVFYLAPQKALAEEKYKDFRNKFQKLGISTVISHRDRKDHDKQIHKGAFHIAVVVFEKMQSLLIANPNLLDKVGLVVIDEIQMVSDNTRGAGLEVLITKLLIAEEKPQIVGLSAVLPNPQKIATWMNANLCEDDTRPVELRKGVLYNSVFRYKEHNSNEVGNEELLVGGMNPLVDQVCDFVKQGEQCIVICNSRGAVERTAENIAEQIDSKKSKVTFNELSELEDSANKDLLLKLLGKGVAFHSSNLDWDQREVIEKGFKSGDISVVCSTSTLAIGLNMPARNVFIDPERFIKKSNGRWGTENISQEEYENMCGRAGRYGYEKNYGRAIIVAKNEFEFEAYYKNFVQGHLREIEPALMSVPLAHHALNLIASGLARSEDQAEKILMSSLTGSTIWSKNPEHVSKNVTDSIRECLEGALIKKSEEGDLFATEVGKLTASKGINIYTANQMSLYASNNKAISGELDILEILFFLTGCDNGANISMSLSTDEYKTANYEQVIVDQLDALEEVRRNRLAKEINTLVFPKSYTKTQRIKKLCILNDWISGVPSKKIESQYCTHVGTIYNFASEYAWLTESFIGVVQALGWNKQTIESLKLLIPRLTHGVIEKAIALTPLRSRGFARGNMMTLVEAGITSVEDVASMNLEEYPNLLSTRLLEQAKLSAERHLSFRVAQDDIVEEEPGNSIPESDSEVQEWEEKQPLSDELGVEYKCACSVTLDGQMNGEGRYLIKVDTAKTWLTEKHFRVLLVLALEAKSTDLGWKSAHDFNDDPQNFAQTIRRLRKDIKDGGTNQNCKELIENNRGSGYRISVPPANIKINQKRVSENLAGGHVLFEGD